MEGMIYPLHSDLQSQHPTEEWEGGSVGHLPTRPVLMRYVGLLVEIVYCSDIGEGYDISSLFRPEITEFSNGGLRWEEEGHLLTRPVLLRYVGLEQR